MANIPLKTIKFPGLDDTYTVPQVDSTLAVSGAAADAKATGDEISELNERLDDEIADVKQDLTMVEDFENPKIFLTWEYGGISIQTGENIFDGSTSYSRIVGYIKSTDISKIVSNFTEITSAYLYEYSYNNNTYTFTGYKGISENAEWNYTPLPDNENRYFRIAFNGSATKRNLITVYKNVELIHTVSDIDKNFNNILYLENGSLNSYDGGEVSYIHVTRTKHLNPSEFGQLFINNGKYRTAIFYYDENGTKLSSTGWNRFSSLNHDVLVSFYNGSFANVKYIRFIIARINASDQTYLDPSVVMNDNIYYSIRNYEVNKSIYANKKISIYGDSISTFTGWIPTGNATYYTGSNAGVPTVYDTWWMKVISALEMDLLINNSWSGRAVSSVRDNVSGHETDAGYKEANVLQLKDGTTLPEVIIIKLGINDFNSGAELGTYDGSTELPTDPAKFTDAYAIMLNLIMTNYPLAQVYCCTLMQCERTGSQGFPEINSRGDSISEWNKAIVKLAHAFGAKVLDHDTCGLTYYNMSEYMGDYASGSGLHPNAKGHTLIANATIDEMDNSVRVRY